MPRWLYVALVCTIVCFAGALITAWVVLDHQADSRSNDLAFNQYQSCLRGNLIRATVNALILEQNSEVPPLVLPDCDGLYEPVP